MPKKKLPAMFKTPAMKKLAWNEEPIGDALERTGYEALDMEAEEVMPDNPESAWVHEGNVDIAGVLELTGTLDGTDVACFVIDGNLTVDGPLFFTQHDFHSALYVTGDLHCKNAFLEAECQLLVGKKFLVDDLLYTFLSDAGHMIVGGLRAKYWLNEWYRGAVYVRSTPEVTMLRGGDHKYLLDRDDDDDSTAFRAKTAKSVFDVLDAKLIQPEEGAERRKLREAMAKGKPLFK